VRTSTTIKFGLPKDSDVRIEVFNIAGQKVKTLASGKLNAGYHTVTWKGANDNGQKVAAGVYLVRMVTPEFTGTRKMTVLR
jgi:flagellar hook assembly protein FlgD